MEHVIITSCTTNFSLLKIGEFGAFRTKYAYGHSPLILHAREVI